MYNFVYNVGVISLYETLSPVTVFQSRMFLFNNITTVQVVHNPDRTSEVVNHWRILI